MTNWNSISISQFYLGNMLGIDYVPSNFKICKNVPLSRISCMTGNTELTWEVQEMPSSEDMLIKTWRLKRNQQEGALQENREVRGSQHSPGKRPGRPGAEQMATGAEQRESIWSMSAVESEHLYTNLDGGLGKYVGEEGVKKTHLISRLWFGTHGKMAIPLSEAENINIMSDLEEGVELRKESTKFGSYEALGWKYPEDNDCELVIGSPLFFLAFVPILTK